LGNNAGVFITALRPAPEGGFVLSQWDILKIARRFNAGSKFRIAKVPQGRLNEFHVLRYDERYLWD